jgi:replicative DNA helicase
LLRVYGEIKFTATPTYSDLVEVIEKLKKEQQDMREELKNLAYRLEFTSVTKSQTRR